MRERTKINKKIKNVANIVAVVLKSQDSATKGMKHPELCPPREGGTAPVGRQRSTRPISQRVEAPCLASPLRTINTLLLTRR